MIRIEIFDSSPIYSRGLVEVLHGARFRVTATRTSVLEYLPWRADVLLLDPDTASGHELDEFIVKTSSIAPLLLLVQPYGRPDTVEWFQRLGAQGVLPRNAPAHLLIDAVRILANGGQFVAGDLYPTVDERPAAAVGQGSLSPREQQVLQQIAHGRTHSQIGRAMGISRHTVDTYVKRIRAKLDLGNKAELARAAVLGGYGGGES